MKKTIYLLVYLLLHPGLALGSTIIGQDTNSAVNGAGTSQVTITAPGFATPGAVSLYNSTINLSRTDNTNTIKVTGFIDTLQTNGGGASSIPIGFMGRVDITGGTFNHAVAVLGWHIPTVVVGDYRGIEGRVDANIAGIVGTGAEGLVFFNALNNAGTTLYGVVGDVECSQGCGTGTGVGAKFVARGGGTNINAIFGDGSSSGDNASVLFQGYSTPKGGVMTAAISVSDTLHAWYFDAGDSGLNGMYLHLRDNAGGSSFIVFDSGFGIPLQVDSAGNLTVESTLLVKATTLGTCGSGTNVEGITRMIASSGATPTKLCTCRFTATGSTFVWVNALTATAGTSTTC